MMDFNKLTIDGIEYQRVKPASDVRIAILQRGWVFIGRFTQSDEEYILTNAKCIRRWGSTAGIGQLASGGPTPETVLDDAGTVRFHALTAVAMLDCDSSKWNI